MGEAIVKFVNFCLTKKPRVSLNFITVVNFLGAGSSCFITCVYQETIRRSFRAVGKVVRSTGKFKDETDVSKQFKT